MCQAKSNGKVAVIKIAGLTLGSAKSRNLGSKL